MKDRIILDLCGGTGAWSKPYVDAGYDVRIITRDGIPLFSDSKKTDVRKYTPPENVYGILAAPPCTEFSFAKTRSRNGRNLATGMCVVEACLEIIWECQSRTKGVCPKLPYLKFWALENPVGMLSWFLGKPAMVFQPFEFGDRYQKPTCLWGNFNEPQKNPIELTDEEKVKFGRHSQKLKPLPSTYSLPEKIEKRAARRSITPPGFANAFFEANR